MASIYSIGYVNSTIFLLLLSGIYLLKIDVRNYRNEGMRRELKVTRIIAWLNICLGASTWLGAWIYDRYFW